MTRNHLAATWRLWRVVRLHRAARLAFRAGRHQQGLRLMAKAGRMLERNRRVLARSRNIA